MLRTTTLSILLSASLALQAQELPDSLNWIENGSFEEFDGKLKRTGSISMAKGWNSPTEAAADLFSESVKDVPVSAPSNVYGDQTALSGVNYAGVRWWSYLNKEPRNYLQAKFKKPLKKGQKYCIRYYVSLSDLSKYGTAELGAYVSKMKVDKKGEASLTYKAQVPNLRTELYLDPFTWQGVCGTFDGTGEENYLIIGNFAENEQVNNEKIEAAQGETRPQAYHAYYYIDDVAVWPIKTPSECTCTQLDEMDTEFIYGRGFGLKSNLPPAQRLDQIVVYFKRFDKGIAGSMDGIVAEMAEIMSNDASLKIKLVGHTDGIELGRVRMRPDLAELDKERAESVKAALVKAGIDAGRIAVAGVGAGTPADEGDSEVALSKNRRVEVELE